MTQLTIVTDINRCVGCLACSVACKVVNNVPIGSFWNKTLRIGPNPTEGGSGQYPDVEMYFLNVQCQHCKKPQCVDVCPTGASQKLEDGTVQIDKSKCIGCQFCVMACPYNVRYLNEEERVVEKCTLCAERTANGNLPQCVSQCCGMARWFGDIEAGIKNLRGPNDCTLGDFIEPYEEVNVQTLPDLGNEPSFRYILRKFKWQGGK
jgi:Fe-S-cluster-containing dehydrogenase component